MQIIINRKNSDEEFEGGKYQWILHVNICNRL